MLPKGKSLKFLVTLNINSKLQENYNDMQYLSRELCENFNNFSLSIRRELVKVKQDSALIDHTNLFVA
jgi:hypothetical protein